ncbi:MAG: hypothetical protein AB7P04_13730 [Bacteriovoracia bacterium]
MAGKSDVGTETLSYCTSCKMDLTHFIVAMKGDKIAKVECKTCKKTHAFKAPKGITEPGQKKTRASKKATAEIKTVEAEWERLMTTHKDAPMKSYTMKTLFSLGDKVNHKNFGEGIVGRLIYPNKIEVVFRTDVKILIHQGVKTP